MFLIPAICLFRHSDKAIHSAYHCGNREQPIDLSHTGATRLRRSIVCLQYLNRQQDKRNVGYHVLGHASTTFTAIPVVMPAKTCSSSTTSPQYPHLLHEPSLDGSSGFLDTCNNRIPVIYTLAWPCHAAITSTAAPAR
jgi:hypothetical protein